MNEIKCQKQYINLIRRHTLRDFKQSCLEAQPKNTSGTIGPAGRKYEI